MRGISRVTNPPRVEVTREALRGLADEFVATLPANVQSIVRARRAG